MGFYETIVWPTLRLIDAERAHNLAIRTAGFIQEFRLLRNILSICCSFTDPRLEFTWKGLSFPNPIGLAAGADKDGRIVGLLPVLGFGFVEVGTVTLEPQPGNPRPRVFRFPRRRAMINSLGFPSRGSDVVSDHLARLESPIPLGINIGKNAETGLSGAASEYAGLLEKLYKFGDYFVMNVSSPNTLGLRSLQGKPALNTLARELAATRARIVDSTGGEEKPVLIKISPDLTFGELDGVLDTVIGSGLDGVVATNTSVDPARKSSGLVGGVSGEPLRERAREMVGYIRRHTPEDFFIVGVGGVFDERDAWALLRAGANVVQLYTGLVYKGPLVVKSIKEGLIAMLEAAELPSVKLVAGYKPPS